MTGWNEKFGAFVRRKRQGKGVGLRQMAKIIDVSPTYLSKIERDEFAPPAEDKVKAIAKILDCDSDELLARAGRVASDITDTIKRRPVELAGLLRITSGFSPAELSVLRRHAEEVKSESPSLKTPKLSKREV